MRHLLAVLFFGITSVLTHADSPHLGNHSCKNGLGLSFGVATLCLPSEFYRNAVIASSGGLVVKFGDGSYFYVHAISREEEGLPESFDMRTYGEYLMGSGPSDKLSAQELEKFKNSRKVLLERYGNKGIRTEEFQGYDALIAEDEHGGEAFLTFEQRSDALLLLGYSGIQKDKLYSIKEGFK